MDLYLCEKPSQAKDLARALKIERRGEGCLHDGAQRTVTWAFGHLLELCMPDAYDPALKSWRLDTLPIVPEEWRYTVKPSAEKQLRVIKGLLSRASRVFIATDYDREGEAIARSILDHCRYRGTVQRVCLRALDDTSIRRALDDIRPGKASQPLYHAALARSRADWLIGMNGSRLYTVLARNAGYRETLHVGRVITPTVALVCQRDNEIANFTPVPYYVLAVDVSVQNGTFRAFWQPPEELADEQGRCINKAFAEQVAQQVRGDSAVISTAETKPGKESAPLPFCLTSLQQYAAKRWGYTAQQVLDGAQALYETHKATTYPRTDSRYLPESQREDIADTLQGLMLSDANFSGLVAGADATRNSRAYNDAKVTAHHAIIPTPARTDISKMSELEYNLYDAIRRFWVANFYAPFEFSRTKIMVTAGQHIFAAQGKTPVKQGWKVIFNSDLESSPEDESEGKGDRPEQASLPPMSQGEPAVINGAELADKLTRPPPHFTEATLLAAMENIARFVDEPRFREILKATAGLGTPATRAGTIQGAVDRGYLVRQKKTLHASDKAKELIALLPDTISSPAMTALWEQELEKIADGHLPMSLFLEKIAKWLSGWVADGKRNAQEEGSAVSTAFAGAKETAHACFTCGGDMRRIKGKYGFFWGCRSTACGATFPDQRGKPQPRPTAEETPSCPLCGSAMRLRSGKAPGKTRASKFWGCSTYPACKGTLPYKKMRKSN